MIPFIKNILHFLKSVLAVIYFRYPARKMKVVGVTGTDGKTTTSTLIYYLLLAAGKKVALVSTVAAYIGKKEIDTGLHVTSPNPWFLQKLTRKIANEGYEYLVLEATSHGLDQHRLLGTNVSIAVLTNITHEHLDYHKTYARYLKAKAKLFRNVDVAVLNKNNSSYAKIRKILKQKIKVISYDGKTLRGEQSKVIKKRFGESYNRLNATAAILVAKELGLNTKAIIKGIKDFPGVSGRMEEIKNKKGIKIFIDFAHTPNALKEVLFTLKKTQKGKGRLIAVFGCAGERDVLKRPIMGMNSVEIANISIFTAEDPRHENVDTIIDSIVVGAKKAGGKEVKFNLNLERSFKNKIFIRIPDRRKAIKYVLQKIAKRGDTVVICGKGHEKSMAFGSKEISWSDQKVVNQYI